MGMTEEIRPGIFLIGVPLPDSPLKELHAYLIKGERNLLVDTGFNHPLAWQALLGALAELKCSPENTDVFLTHVHVDHSGLSYKMKRPENKVYCNRTDGAYLHSLLLRSFEDLEEEQRVKTLAFGIPEERRLSIADHPYVTYGPEKLLDYTPIEPGDILETGRYRFEAVPLYGHTPGHLGLFEREHRLLFCGDHILRRITPNIVSWDENLDSLAQFIGSLKYVRQLDIGLLLPAHRGPIEDTNERIDELLIHHKNRLSEVSHALKEGNRTVYQCSKHVRWDFSGGNIDAFPPTQLWFAASETHVHLEHLRFNKLAVCTETGGCYHYTLTERAENL